MTQTIRLEHVGIPAHGDLYEQTVTFYERVFGWKRAREINGAMRLCFLTDGSGGTIEVIDVQGPAIPNPSHLAFAVPLDEFEAARDRLAEAGVAFDPVVDNGAGDLLAYFNDPAGNRAQLVGRKVPLELD